ncbi:ankyrin-like protein [Artemisia annua]|uniref:Ankyrin-like protein n=1 Tax=Artemisia annua TaxID=35608 RepID=A0A2U1KSD2_ARTAN|nr:ankyrin-like protein [Artemisia annua]
MSKLTKAMCGERMVIYKDRLNQVSAAIYRKPTSNECFENRQENDPPLCEINDDPNVICLADATGLQLGCAKGELKADIFLNAYVRVFGYCWNVGSSLPREFGQLAADIKANTPDVKNV